MTHPLATFDLAAPFVARVGFAYAGRTYAAGEAFPWHDVANERDLRTLWRAMKVKNGAPPVEAKAPSVAPPKPAKPAKRPHAGV